MNVQFFRLLIMLKNLCSLFRDRCLDLQEIGMTGATYLVRFDDICPTMNWESWDQIEAVLISLNIKPLLAVVPDNQDEKLKVSKLNTEFWSRVRKWQSLGWSIAVHGYQHRYQTKEAGLMRLNKYSEFSGLPYSVQNDYLTKAFAIFERNNVRPDLWIAPAHSFDKITIQVLSEHGIKVISDGFYVRSIKRLGMIWVPQQLWQFRNFRFGQWTVCYHLNSCSKVELDKICSDLIDFKNKITTLEKVVNRVEVANYGILDAFFSYFWRKALAVKIAMRR